MIDWKCIKDVQGAKRRVSPSFPIFSPCQPCTCTCALMVVETVIAAVFNDDSDGITSSTTQSIFLV